MSERVPTETRAASVGTGAVAGTLAYVLGYVLTYLWQASSVQDVLARYNFVLELAGSDPIPTWKGVGWLFYNAHAVAFTHPAVVGGGRVSRNVIADGNAPMLLYLVPPVVLVLAGFVLARSANRSDPAAGARTGARVVAGYAVFAVLGLVAFQHSVGGAAVHPEYALGALLAGVVYPLAFGAAGGALGASTST